MELPTSFTETVCNTYGQDGERFLVNLPDSISEASARWDLTDVQPVPNLSYNFVAFALRRPGVLPGSGADGRVAERIETGGRQVILKMGVPNGEMESEMAALKLFNGEGACQLLACDEERYWMLLEHLKPGVMLSTLEDDEEATHIAADVMPKIWRHPPDDDVFIRLSDWFDGLKRLRAEFDGGTGPLNQNLVEHVEHSVKDLLVENHQPVLMHGDFHHYNILSSERGWLVIDPKGVIGPAGYEVGPLLINPWEDLINMQDCRQMTRRRIDILHERLGFERERIREWGLSHAILSAWWGIEDNTGWEYSLAFAEMIAELTTK